MNDRKRGWSRLGVGLGAISALVVADLAMKGNTNFSGALVVGPLLAALSATPIEVATLGVIAVVVGLVLGVVDHQPMPAMAVRLTVVIVGSLAAVLAASRRLSRERQLVRVSRVAEVAQRAILPPTPPRLGPGAFAGRYLSAAEDAAVGGDGYEVVAFKDRVRFMVVDVRGKGLDAVRLAAGVLGAFREAAESLETPSEVVLRIDDRLDRHLNDEDFVTAVVGELRPDGEVRVVNCGHHPPFVVRRGGGVELARNRPTRPFGLEPTPVEAQGFLAPGDRLVLFTDGLFERCGPAGSDLDPALVVSAARYAADVEAAADAVLAARADAGAPSFVDDLALLVVEFVPNSVNSTSASYKKVRGSGRS